MLNAELESERANSAQRVAALQADLSLVSHDCCTALSDQRAEQLRAEAAVANAEQADQRAETLAVKLAEAEQKLQQMADEKQEEPSPKLQQHLLQHLRQ